MAGTKNCPSSARIRPRVKLNADSPLAPACAQSGCRDGRAITTPNLDAGAGNRRGGNRFERAAHDLVARALPAAVEGVRRQPLGALVRSALVPLGTAGA